MDTSLEDAGEYSCVVSNVDDEEIASAHLQVQGTTLMRIDLMFEWISIFNIHFISSNKTNILMPNVSIARSTVIISDC